MTIGSAVGLDWIPEFVYENCDVPVTATLTLPMRNWRYLSKPEGGFDRAASGVGESFVIRHDRIYALPLRCTETEWVTVVEPMLEIITAQEQAFTVQLDKSDASTLKTVRLISPVAGEQIAPTPDATFPAVLEYTLTVRSDDGTAFSYPYFTAP